MEPILLNRLQCSCGDSDSDELVSLLPPQLAGLKVNILNAVSVSVRLGYVHAFTVLASASKVALSLTHHELRSSGLMKYIMVGSTE